MTECERIIAEGILPKSFFEEEERCGFMVSTERKKIWAIEIDLYIKFAEVCKKYGFRFYSLFGTILGAVRHKGMIPWDDDIDVCMPREDYERFCSIAVSDFKDPYFLQTPYTDKGYFYSFAKIRNLNTTCMPFVMSKSGFCHGIFLDVFPLDFCNPDTYADDRKAIYQCIMKCSSFMKRNCDNLDEEQRVKIKQFNTTRPLEEFETIQKIATNPLYRNSRFLGVPVNTFLKEKQLIWETANFAGYIELPFENILMRVPSGYHNILQTTYGYYMEFPPKNQRGKWHSGVIWNPDESYLYYINNHE